MNAYAAAALALMTLAAACRQAPADPPPDAAARASSPVSVNELMVSLVDPAANRVWEAGYDSPASETAWRRVELNAINLVAAGALVVQGGSGPRDADWAGDADWHGWTIRMQAASMAARAAAQNQDAQALATAGDALLDTCTGCHTAFMPETPTGGLYAMPDLEF